MDCMSFLQDKLESQERHPVSPELVTGRQFYCCLNDCPPKDDGGTNLELTAGYLHVPLPAYGEKLIQPCLELLDVLSRSQNIINILIVPLLIVYGGVSKEIKIICGAHQALGEAREAVLPLREDHC